MRLSDAEISGLRAGVERELDFAVKMVDYVRELAMYRKLTVETRNKEERERAEAQGSEVTASTIPAATRKKTIRIFTPNDASSK
jgi:hypothetical protein